MSEIEHKLGADPIRDVGGLDGPNRPRGVMWIPGKYAPLPALRRQAKLAGISIAARATKEQVVAQLRAAGIEPRQPGLPD